MADDEPAAFDNALEFTGWLILRGGLSASEFAAMPAGRERQFMVAALARAEQIRVRELQQFADAVARLMGGANGS